MQQEDCLSLSDRLHCVVYNVYRDNDISASTRSRKIRPAEAQKLDGHEASAAQAIGLPSKRLAAVQGDRHKQRFPLARSVVKV